MSKLRLPSIAVLLLAAQLASGAPCANKFLNRTEGPRQRVTLLTGKLTFQEAQELAKSIGAKQAPPLEWVDDHGKTIAKQFGALQVLRPMPVGCDGKTSGVVMTVTFATTNTPTKKINVKLDATTTVAFEEQGR